MLANKSLVAILVALLFFVTILGNFVYSLNSFTYYSEFDKLDVNQTIAGNVVDFVQGRATLLEDFNSREATHLENVRSLFSITKRLYYASLFVLIILLLYLFKSNKFKQTLPHALLFSGVISLLLLLLIFLLSLNFADFFNNLHRPLFASGSWIFPKDSLLITSFPQQFFEDFTRSLLRLVFVNSALFIGIGLFMRKKFKQQNLNSSK